MTDVPAAFNIDLKNLGDKVGKDASSQGSLGGSFVDGFVGGAAVTWDFVKSQFTWRGYLETQANIFTFGAYGSMQTINGAINLASNIPNCTANDLHMEQVT